MTIEELDKALRALEPLPDAEFLAKAKEICKTPWFKENAKKIFPSPSWMNFCKRQGDRLERLLDLYH